eukprot:1593067-Pyramimonas_sp.AAC.1
MSGCGLVSPPRGRISDDWVDHKYCFRGRTLRGWGSFHFRDGDATGRHGSRSQEQDLAPAMGMLRNVPKRFQCAREAPALPPIHKHRPKLWAHHTP